MQYFVHKVHQKSFVGWSPPVSAGEVYSAPKTLQLNEGGCFAANGERGRNESDGKEGKGERRRKGREGRSPRTKILTTALYSLVSVLQKC